MFFAIQKGETTRMVKANNYDELVLKATSSFKVNPNIATLTFADPSGDQILLDSEDTYEYVEQRTQEIKAENNASYKPTIKLSGGDQPMPQPPVTQATSISRASVNDAVIKPVPQDGRSSDAGEVIF